MGGKNNATIIQQSPVPKFEITVSSSNSNINNQQQQSSSEN